MLAPTQTTKVAKDDIYKNTQCHFLTFYKCKSSLALVAHQKQQN